MVTKLTFYQKIIVGIILFIVLIQWMVNASILPQMIGWIPDFLIIFLAISVYFTEERGIVFLVSKYLFLVLAIVIISTIANQVNLSMLIIFGRALFRYYLLGCVVYSIAMNEEQEKFFIKLIFSILILQIFVAPVKVILIGLGESPMSLIGSSITTFTVLTGFSLALSYGLFEKKWKYMSFLMAGFMIVAVAGGKRGVIFLVPVLLIYALIKLRTKKIVIKAKKTLALLVLVFAWLLIVVVCKSLPTLNPEGTFWGSLDYKFAYEYAVKTSLEVDPETNLPTGRISSFFFTLNKISSSPIKILFGNGPGISIRSTVTKTSQYKVISDTGVHYGQNGLVWIMVQIGILGAVVFFVMLTKFSSYAKYCLLNDSNESYKVFYSFMILYTFIITFIAYIYSPAFKGLFTDSIFYISAGILCKRFDKVVSYLENKKIPNNWPE